MDHQEGKRAVQIDFVAKECPVIFALLLREKHASCTVDW